MNRREFLTGSAALMLTSNGFCKTTIGNIGKPNMRLGVLSDIHIVDSSTVEPFESVLRVFDRARVDGVLICGDLADYGVIPQLQVVAEAWFKVFPNNRRSDGEPVVNLMHYGDHDTTGLTYRNAAKCVEMYPKEADMIPFIIGRQDRKQIWEDCFHEEWSPIMHRRVKGYDFVLANFTRGESGNPTGDNTPGLENYLDSLGLDARRPFFYSQHRVYKNTCCGPFVWGQEDGTTGSILSAKYPNAIAFCGHAHQHASEYNLWRGGFTAIQVPSLRYSCSVVGDENDPSTFHMNGATAQESSIDAACFTMPRTLSGEGNDFTRQGYIIDVYDDKMIVYTREFKRNLSLGLPWVVPFVGALPTLEAPVFPDGAKVVVKEVNVADRTGTKKNMYELTFPAANSKGTHPRAYDYEVAVVVDGKRVVSRKFFSKRFLWGEKEDPIVVARMLKSDVPEGRSFSFEVTARNAAGLSSEVL